LAGGTFYLSPGTSAACPYRKFHPVGVSIAITRAFLDAATGSAALSDRISACGEFTDVARAGLHCCGVFFARLLAGFWHGDVLSVRRGGMPHHRRGVTGSLCAVPIPPLKSKTLRLFWCFTCYSKTKGEKLLAIDEAEDALALLKAVYQNPEVALSVRIKAAIERLPFERPRFAVTATLEGQGLGALPEARLKRLAEKKLLSPLIEVEAVE
jgi:hypothetical protein